VPARRSSFEYAVIRVVPRVDREEFVNAGVVVFCLEHGYLQARIRFDESRLKALWPESDLETIRAHLEAIPKICGGSTDAGPIAALSLRERFHWLVSPRSTVIQVSAPHAGMCADPAETLDRLFDQLVR
jgi:hypothetical protein